MHFCHFWLCGRSGHRPMVKVHFVEASTMKTAPTFRPLTGEADLPDAFELMRELRPHLTERAAFLAQMARQIEPHYRLLRAWLGTELVGLPGCRTLANRLYRRCAYVDAPRVAR